MKRMQGAFFLAVANMSLTLAGPTPTNISRNSEPDTGERGEGVSVLWVWVWQMCV